MDLAKIRKKLKAEKEKASSKKKRREEPRPEDEESAASLAPQDKGPEGPPADSPVDVGAAGAGVEKADPAEAESAPDDGEHDELPDEEMLELLAFDIRGEYYAFRVSEVVEILRGQEITMVPRVEPFVLGVTSVRGRIVPVLDIGSRLSLEKTEGAGGDRTKTVVLRGPKGPIGVAIKSAVDIVSLPESDVKGPPGQTERDGFIEGVAVLGDRLVSIISQEVFDFPGTVEAQ